MKNILIFLLLLQSSLLYGKINIVTSIIPVKTFVTKIAQNKADVTVMVKQGSSPHTYEPKPSQMVAIHKANLYFAIGVEFEKSWLSKFHNQNPNMKIIDLSQDITKTKDPHIWTSPDKVKKIVKNILNSLIEADPNNKTFYTTNYNNYIGYINNLDNKIKSILKNKPTNSSFMVFHPSWGYFAQQYHLKQIAIQIDGKSPKPRELIKLIKYGQKENIQAIIASNEFSTKIANQIAKTLHIPVIKISPLAPNWGDNMLKIAKAISK